MPVNTLAFIFKMNDCKELNYLNLNSQLNNAKEDMTNINAWFLVLSLKKEKKSISRCESDCIYGAD